MHLHDLVFNLGAAAVDLWFMRRLGAALTPSGDRDRTFSVWTLLQAGVRAQGLQILGAVLLGLGVERNPFAFLRLLAFALFLHGGLQLLAAAWLLARRARPRPAAACFGALATLAVVAVVAFLIEPRWLEVSHHRLTSAKIEHPLKIAVLADLQTDRVGPWERKVIARALAEEPDLILFPGDYLQVETFEAFTHRSRELRELFGELDLRAPLGVYTVGGNTDSRDWPAIFAGLPVVSFVDTGFVDIGTLDTGDLRVTGLSLRDSFDRRLSIPHPGGFHIVFGHGPDFALGEVEADLLIAGHTHGGQVRLPGIGPLITFSRIPRTWATGVTRLPDRGPDEEPRTLVVSRGLGMERGRAPRLRFLCRPELVILHLDPAEAVAVNPG